MKKTTLILLGILALVANVVNAQMYDAFIVLNDSTQLKGLAKVRVGSSTLKFKKDSRAKKKIYHFNEIQSVTIYYETKPITYVYMAYDKIELPIIMEEVITGSLSLYQTVTYGTHAGFGADGFGGGAIGNTYTITNYYVKKENDQVVTHLGSTNLFSKNFKKAASGFFGDCPSLLQKIESKELKKRDIKEIIEYYNNHCI